MKILFIGGTGNISLAVSRLLLEQEHELWLLTRNGAHPQLADAQFIQGDIHSRETQQLLEAHEWDVVVNWVLFTPEEAQRDIQIFSGRTAQYIFISSASCYKTPGPTPYITERTPLENPYWLYSRNKIEAEQTFQAARQTDGFPITIVRPSHTYSTVLPLTIGGWQEYTTIARIKAGKPIVVQGDGTSLWTLTHADDFARGFAGLIGQSETIGEDFHITSDEFLTWNEIYQLTARTIGREADIVHVASDAICRVAPEYTGTLLGDKSHSALFDNSKIKAAVPGFQATIPLAQGIRRALEWFEAETHRQYIDPQTDALIDTLVDYARHLRHPV